MSDDFSYIDRLDQLVLMMAFWSRDGYEEVATEGAFDFRKKLLVFVADSVNHCLKVHGLRVLLHYSVSFTSRLPHCRPPRTPKLSQARIILSVKQRPDSPSS